MTVKEAIARAWTDAGFKAKLLSDPNAALAGAGVEIPEGVKINVVENTADTQHIVLPVAPDQTGEVSVDDLERASG